MVSGALIQPANSVCEAAQDFASWHFMVRRRELLLPWVRGSSKFPHLLMPPCTQRRAEGIWDRDRCRPFPRMILWVGGKAENRAPLSRQTPNPTASQLLCDTLFVWALCFLCQEHRTKHSFTKAFNVKKKPQDLWSESWAEV